MPRRPVNSEINVDADDIDAIYDFLEEVTTTGSVDIGETLQDKGELAIKTLNKIFSWTERNEQHIGAIVYYIVHEEDPDSNLKENLSFGGKTIADLNEQWQEGYARGDEYPLFALPFYLQENKGLYEQDTEGGLKTSVKNLLNLLSNIKDMPVLLKQLLKVHDEIRKIMGKEVNFAMRPMTIDNYEEVIEKIYTNHDVDLAHLEVENIVQEVDSFSNIAKSYGITEEIVYQVKSEFR